MPRDLLARHSEQKQCNALRVSEPTTRRVRLVRANRRVLPRYWRAVRAERGPARSVRSRTASKKRSLEKAQGSNMFRAISAHSTVPDRGPPRRWGSAAAAREPRRLGGSVVTGTSRLPLVRCAILKLPVDIARPAAHRVLRGNATSPPESDFPAHNCSVPKVITSTEIPRFASYVPVWASLGVCRASRG